MRQSTDRPLGPGLAVPVQSSVGALVRRLALTGLLLAALTLLASVALATQL